MEVNQPWFLEELLAPKRETLNTNEYFPSGWNFESFDENPNPSFGGFSNQTELNFQCPFYEPYCFDGGTSAFQIQEDYPSMVEDEDHPGFLSSDNFQYCFEDEERKNICRIEMDKGNDFPVFNMGFCEKNKSKGKSKLEGQPSKNLMAERRRRKRLNDRLSLLRSIVPKISKMDRTSILGDTIDYVKELLERINNLQEKEVEKGTDSINSVSIFKEHKPNEALVRNSPKFDVEKREMDTRIDICCAAKPGLLLSTVTTIEALGLEIKQCVISCFNEFSLQATCSEVIEQQTLIGSEDMKQALFQNAGYGGTCL